MTTYNRKGTRCFGMFVAALLFFAVSMAQAEDASAFEGASEFDDVADNAWYSDYLFPIAHDPLFEGDQDGRFHPYRDLTRAEATVLLLRAEEIPIPDTLTEKEAESFPFSDVSVDDWSAPALMTAYDEGIMNGYSDGTSGAKKEITRHEMSALAVRAFDVEADPGQEIDFSDLKTDHWAYEYTATLSSLGIIQGFKDGTFRGDTYVSRAETSAFLARSIDPYLRIQEPDVTALTIEGADFTLRLGHIRPALIEKMEEDLQDGGNLFQMLERLNLPLSIDGDPDHEEILTEAPGFKDLSVDQDGNLTIVADLTDHPLLDFPEYTVTAGDQSAIIPVPYLEASEMEATYREQDGYLVMFIDFGETMTADDDETAITQVDRYGVLQGMDEDTTPLTDLADEVVLEAMNDDEELVMFLIGVDGPLSDNARLMMEDVTNEEGMTTDPDHPLTLELTARERDPFGLEPEGTAFAVDEQTITFSSEEPLIHLDEADLLITGEDPDAPLSVDEATISSEDAREVTVHLEEEIPADLDELRLGVQGDNTFDRFLRPLDVEEATLTDEVPLRVVGDVEVTSGNTAIIELNRSVDAFDTGHITIAGSTDHESETFSQDDSFFDGSTLTLVADGEPFKHQEDLELHIGEGAIEDTRGFTVGDVSRSLLFPDPPAFTNLTAESFDEMRLSVSEDLDNHTMEDRTFTLTDGDRTFTIDDVMLDENDQVRLRTEEPLPANAAVTLSLQGDELRTEDGFAFPEGEDISGDTKTMAAEDLDLQKDGFNVTLTPSVYETGADAGDVLGSSDEILDFFSYHNLTVSLTTEDGTDLIGDVNLAFDEGVCCDGADGMTFAFTHDNLNLFSKTNSGETVTLSMSDKEATFTTQLLEAEHMNAVYREQDDFLVLLIDYGEPMETGDGKTSITQADRYQFRQGESEDAVPLTEFADEVELEAMANDEQLAIFLTEPVAALTEDAVLLLDEVSNVGGVTSGSHEALTLELTKDEPGAFGVEPEGTAVAVDEQTITLTSEESLIALQEEDFALVTSEDPDAPLAIDAIALDNDGRDITLTMAENLPDDIDSLRLNITGDGTFDRFLRPLYVEDATLTDEVPLRVVGDIAVTSGDTAIIELNRDLDGFDAEKLTATGFSDGGTRTFSQTESTLDGHTLTLKAEAEPFAREKELELQVAEGAIMDVRGMALSEGAYALSFPAPPAFTDLTAKSFHEMRLTVSNDIDEDTLDESSFIITTGERSFPLSDVSPKEGNQVLLQTDEPLPANDSVIVSVDSDDLRTTDGFAFQEGEEISADTQELVVEDLDLQIDRFEVSLTPSVFETAEDATDALTSSGAIIDLFNYHNLPVSLTTEDGTELIEDVNLTLDEAVCCNEDHELNLAIDIDNLNSLSETGSNETVTLTIGEATTTFTTEDTDGIDTSVTHIAGQPILTYSNISGTATEDRVYLPQSHPASHIQPEDLTLANEDLHVTAVSIEGDHVTYTVATAQGSVVNNQFEVQVNEADADPYIPKYEENLDSSLGGLPSREDTVVPIVKDDLSIEDLEISDITGDNWSDFEEGQTLDFEGVIVHVHLADVGVQFSIDPDNNSLNDSVTPSDGNNVAFIRLKDSPDAGSISIRMRNSGQGSTIEMHQIYFSTID